MHFRCLTEFSTLTFYISVFLCQHSLISICWRFCTFSPVCQQNKSISSLSALFSVSLFFSFRCACLPSSPCQWLLYLGNIRGSLRQSTSHSCCSFSLLLGRPGSEAGDFAEEIIANEVKELQERSLCTSKRERERERERETALHWLATSVQTLGARNHTERAGDT